MEDYNKFLEIHRPQLVTSGVPPHFWETIFRKLKSGIFDAGETFSLLQIEYDAQTDDYDPLWKLQVKCEDGINKDDLSHVYLIDHAWTFTIEMARKQLRKFDSLRERMATLVGLDPKLESNDLSEQIFNKLWKYCNCYWFQTASNVEDRMPLWYIMDEVGSAIQHSDDPNFKIVPFIYIAENLIYSLIFPIKNLEYRDIVTHNYVGNAIEGQDYAALSLPWVEHSFLETSFLQNEPGPEYFLSGHIEESLPALDCCICLPKSSKLKVCTEYALIQKYLTDEKFEIVTTEAEADILWYTTHFKDFEILSKSPKYINQFPYEYVLTIKDLLSIIARRKQNQDNDAVSSAWLPVTYNLKIELPQFVSYFQHQEKLTIDQNYWIIKPFNLARSLDTHITNNLNFILRLPTTGPKIAQKYIENPVLFYRQECLGKVKFDIRYIVLLKNVKPLEAYVCKNFYLRFANKPFELNNFDDYSQHFTVMNYIDGAKSLKHMLCSDFKKEWKNQYDNINWNDVENSILHMLKEVFECAAMADPPCGIAPSSQSRAMYAADIMLEWSENIYNDIQPKLLEINWTPDCKRACDYYPDFFNEIFNLLFFDIKNSSLFFEL